MTDYVFAYLGGGMPETEEEGQAVMAAWTEWMGGVGAALKDPGAPFGASLTVAADGSCSPGASTGVTGYSIVTADSLDAAAVLAQGCPIFAAGGSLAIHETVAM